METPVETFRSDYVSGLNIFKVEGGYELRDEVTGLSLGKKEFKIDICEWALRMLRARETKEFQSFERALKHGHI